MTTYVPTVTCEQCGSAIRRKPRQSAPEYQRRRYCSKPCTDRARRGQPLTGPAPSGYRLGGMPAAGFTNPDADLTPDWRSWAACRGEDTELFFTEGSTAAAITRRGEAKSICCQCPVRSDCLAWALAARLTYGIYGGHTAKEREAMKGART